MNKITMLGVSAAIAIGSVLGVSLPAHASGSTSDCFPGNTAKNPGFGTCSNAAGRYTSKGGGGTARGQILWDNDEGVIEVTPVIEDKKADGYAPRLVVYYWDGSNTQKRFVLHTGDSYQAFVIETVNPNGPTNNDTVFFQMCNGGNDKTPYNCSDASGMFHHY